MKRTVLVASLLTALLVLGPWPAAACAGDCPCRATESPRAASCHASSAALGPGPDCCTTGGAERSATPPREPLGPAAPALSESAVTNPWSIVAAPSTPARDPVQRTGRALDRCTLFSSLLI